METSSKEVKIKICEGCGKEFDVSHVVMGVEPCPYRGYLNWIEEELRSQKEIRHESL